MKKLARSVWVHVAFFRPMRFPELDEGTIEHEEWEADFVRLVSGLDSMAEDALRDLLAAKILELGYVREDLNQTRQRAGQLLAVTGVLGVLGSLLPTLPAPFGWAWLKVVILLLIGYFFVGTIWLTIGAIRVSGWETLNTKVPAVGNKQQFDLLCARAREAFLAVRNISLRLNGPTGYLKDAYYFFAITAATIAILLLVRAGFS